MHVIASRTIRGFADKHNDARGPLGNWLEVVSKANWANINDIRSIFPRTDPVKVQSGKTVHVFNIKGNEYRLVAAIHFNRQKIYVLRFMTHAEYDKNKWKDAL